MPPDLQKEIQSDHDLLIRLDENVKGLTTIILGLKNDAFIKIAKLEETKVDKDEFTSIVKDFSYHKNDMEKRMRWSEKILYTTIAVSALLQMLGIPLILKYLLNN